MSAGNVSTGLNASAAQCGLMAALRADYLRVFSIQDGNVVPEEVPERDVMPTIELEFPALKLAQNLSQVVSLFILFFLDTTDFPVAPGVFSGSRPLTGSWVFSPVLPACREAVSGHP